MPERGLVCFIICKVVMFIMCLLYRENTRKEIRERRMEERETGIQTDWIKKI